MINITYQQLYDKIKAACYTCQNIKDISGFKNFSNISFSEYKTFKSGGIPVCVKGGQNNQWDKYAIYPYVTITISGSGKNIPIYTSNNINEFISAYFNNYITKNLSEKIPQEQLYNILNKLILFLAYNITFIGNPGENNKVYRIFYANIFNEYNSSTNDIIKAEHANFLTNINLRNTANFLSYIRDIKRCQVLPYDITRSYGVKRTDGASVNSGLIFYGRGGSNAVTGDHKIFNYYYI